MCIRDSVKAVVNGRSVYANIKNAIQFLLSGNTAGIFCVLYASLLALPVPFQPVHLPVSYTHLDVYKRQGEGQGERLDPVQAGISRPVDRVIHLDGQGGEGDSV